MAKNVIQSTILSINGGVSVAPGASIEIRNAASGQLMPLWLDRDGTQPTTNPTTADGNGFFRVYTDAGRVHITASKDGKTQEWRDVELPGQFVRRTELENGTQVVSSFSGGHYTGQASGNTLTIPGTPVDELTGVPKFHVGRRLFCEGEARTITEVAEVEGNTVVTVDGAALSAGSVEVWLGPAAAMSSLGTGAFRDVGSDPTQVPTNQGLPKISVDVWRPEDEPAAQDYIDTNTAGYSDFMALWEALRSDYPDRVSRTQRGVDASGTYPIWEYVIEPQLSAQREILVVCNTHGGEIMGQLATLRAVRQLLSSKGKTEQTKYFNDHVRLYVIPMLNPWGVSQSPRNRNNANGVDLNRNTNYFWAEYDDSNPDPGYGTKGTAPFSEAETQLLKTLVEETHPDLFAVIDAHSYVGSSGNDWRYAAYTPYWGLPSNRQAVYRLTERLKNTPTDPTRVTSEEPKPIITNYAANLGKEALTVEWDLGAHGGGMFSSLDMTKAVEWYGNILLTYSTMASGPKIAVDSPFFKVMEGGILPLSAALPEDGMPMVTPEHVFAVPTDCVIHLTGWARVRPSESLARVYVAPVIGQDGMVPSRYRSSSYRFVSGNVARAQDDVTIPLNRMVAVKAGGNVRWGLRASVSSGGGTLESYYMTLHIIPINGHSKALQHYEQVEDELRERTPYFQAADGSYTILG